ncbi:exonuclease subunit SbcD [Colwelliaceae bacterium 6441]
MAFRVLHTSDWHLGQFFYGKSRANEHQKFLSWLLNQIVTLKADAVIVAGDIFDTGTPPSYAREMYFDFIVKIHQLGCQLIVLAGNHDSVAMLGESKALLSQLSCHVITSASEQTESQVLSLKNTSSQLQAVVCAIPFIRPRDVVLSQAGQTAKEKQQALQQAITEHYQRLYEQAKGIAKDDVPIIATGHLTTVGVSTSESVRDIYIGTLEAFPAHGFPDVDYIALGHIHKSQKVAKSEHIRYCGSPIPLSFDEAKQDKNILLVEFDKNKLSKVTEILVPRFQPMAMLKSHLDALENDVKALVSLMSPVTQDIWLDIEIESADYLADLSHKIERITEAFPVEVLLTRRSKKSRQLMTTSKTKVTLEELKISDVFETRINEENWQTEQELARKVRLNDLFLNTVSQVESQLTSKEVNNKGESSAERQTIKPQGAQS